MVTEVPRFAKYCREHGKTPAETLRTEATVVALGGLGFFWEAQSPSRHIDWSPAHLCQAQHPS